MQILVTRKKAIDGIKSTVTLNHLIKKKNSHSSLNHSRNA